MNSLEKDFAPYKESLELKEIGFDEPCIRGWDKSGKIWYHPDSDIITDNPTFSQAFRWFREKYGYIAEINNYSTSDGYSFSFKILLKKYTPFINANNAWCNYEAAELECLRKLIEIVKSKK